MPTINRIMFKNIGHDKAIFTDLTINCRTTAKPGANTYVLAANGVGKTSLIGLIFKVLRPHAYEFPHGEGKKRRSFSEYIRKGTGHVMIEWVLDEKDQGGNTRYLITGMVVEPKDHLIFYRSSYSGAEAATALGMHNFPVLNRHGEYLTVAEIRRELKGYPQDAVYSTDRQDHWEIELKRWRITPELFRLQAMMNQRESSQDTMLSFGSELTFIQKLVGYITPFDDEENQEGSLKEVKEYLLEVKDMPKVLAEHDYLVDIIDFLKRGVVYQEERQRAHSSLLSELERFNTGLSMLDRLVFDVGRSFDENDAEIKGKRKQKDEAEEKLKGTTARLMQARLSREKAVVGQKKKTLKQYDEEKQGLDKEIRFLEAVPAYREYEQFKNRAESLDARLKERGKPLKEAYELATTHYGIKMKAEIGELSKVQDNRKRERNEINAEISRLSTEKGAKEGEVSRARADITTVTAALERIETQKQDLVIKGAMQEGEDPRGTLERLQRQYEDSDRTLTELSSKSDSARQRQGEIKAEIAKFDADLNAARLAKRDVEKRVNDARSSWRKVVETRYASQELRPELRNRLEPDYDEINDPLLGRVKQLAVDLTLERGKHDVEIKSLDYQSQYYAERGSFPPAKDVQGIITLLEGKGIQARHGWQYLLDSYPNDKNKIAEWVERAPHVLEGIFVQAVDLEAVKKIIITSGIPVEIPVYISLSRALEEHPSRKADATTVLHEVLAWRHDVQERLARYIGLDGAKQELVRLASERTNKIASLSEFEQIAREFLARYPRTEYINMVLENQRKEEEISLLEANISERRKIEKEITKDIDRFNLESTKEKQKKKNIESSMRAVERFLVSWETRDTSIRKKMDLGAQLERLERDVIELKNKIVDLSKKSNNLEDILEQLTKRIQQLRSALDPLLQDPAIATACDRGRGHPEYDNIMAKNLDLLRAEYEAVKKDLETDPETKQIERELQEVREKMVKKRKSIYTPLKGMDRDETLLIEAVNECSIKHAAFDDEQIIALKQKKKEKYDQVTRASGEIDTEIKIGEGVIKNFESKMREEQIPVLELSETIEELENLITQYESEKEQLDQLITDLDDSLNRSIQKLDALKKIKQDGKGEYEQQMLLFSSLSSAVQYRLSGPLPSRPIIPTFEAIVTEWTDIRKNMDQVSNASSDAKKKYDSAIKKANEYLDALHKHAIPKNALLDRSRYPDIFKTFSLDDLESIESNFIRGFTSTIEQFAAHISDHERKRKNIVSVFSTKVLTILGNISDLQKTRVPIPVGDDTLNMHVLEIVSNLQLNGEEDLKEIDRRIEDKFKDFEIHGLPSKITNYKELLEELVGVSYGDGVKQVKFLIPRPGGMKPEYRDLVETLKSSGGEIATVAIMLYILIAHYRMRVEGGEKNTTSPFLMDNPFGKANRFDLVKAQVDLARNLGIQLIVFSGHADASTLAQFDTMQPLRAFAFDGKGFTEIDEETQKEYAMAQIEGGSITFLGEDN